MLGIVGGILVCVIFIIVPILVFMKKATNTQGGHKEIDPYSHTNHSGQKQENQS